MGKGWLAVLTVIAAGCSGAQVAGDGPPLEGLSGDLGVVATADKLLAVSLTGQQRVLATGPVSWCAVDNASRVVWYATAAGEDKLALHVVDLATGHNRAVTDPFPKPDMLVIDRDAGDRIGELRPIHYRVGLMLTLAPTPKLQPRVGCDGDLKWKCYVDATEGRPELKPPLKVLHDAYSALKLKDPAYFSGLFARGQRKFQWSERPDPRLAPRVTAVPASNCADAEDCGLAHYLPGIEFQRVVVKTSAESFALMTYQLYDPSTAEFFSPIDPAQRAKTPLPQQPRLPDLYISPTGKAMMGEGRIIPVPGFGQPNLQGRVSCGWVGGGHFVGSKP
jgi:hypothetical protein